MQNITIENSNVQVESSESAGLSGVVVNYPRISTPLLLIFCGYVIIWYLQIGYRMPALGAIRFEFIYAAVLSALAIFSTPKFHTTSHLLPYIIMYFLVIVIQVPFSYDFDASWEILIDRIIKFAFMAFFIISFVRSPTHLKFFLGAFLLACLKMGQEGLAGRISGSLLWENQGIMRLHGATPLYIDPNSFTGMALGTLPFIYYLWPLSNKKIKVVLFSICVFSLNIVLYTGSRTGYVGALAFLIFIFVNSKNKAKFVAIIILLFIMVLPMVPSDYIERFDSIFTQKDKEGHSTQMRIEILKDATEIFMEHPLGVGVAAFPKVRIEKFMRSQDTHNLYLQVATNLGIQGFIVFSLLVYKLLATLRNIKSSAQNIISELSEKDSRYYGALIGDLKFIEAVALATSSFIFVRLALGLFGMDLYEIYWWFTLGITLSLYGMMKNIFTAINSADKDFSNELSA